MADSGIPMPFIWRRLHSLMGVFLVLFLFVHLLTNSQAALWVGDDGKGFIQEVNLIHSLPYLKVIEIFFLAVPFAIHMLWGLHYLFTSKHNVLPTDGSSPALGKYRRNRAYTLMRLTSWLLLVGVIAHVIHMRFIEYPWAAEVGDQHYYMNVVSMDQGLYTVAARVGVELYDQKRIQEKAASIRPDSSSEVEKTPQERGMALAGFGTLEGTNSTEYDPAQAQRLIGLQEIQQERGFVEALQKKPLNPDQVVVVAKDFGTVSLFIVRDAFKSPLMVALYSLFVLAASFHAFNGLWTSLISWGVTLTPRSQNLARLVTTGLMVLVAFLGLIASVGTYWMNLKH